MRDSFVFYESFYDAISELDCVKFYEIMRAIMGYALYGEEPELTYAETRMIFKLIKPQLDANQKRYEDGKKGAEYGKLGGRPKKNKNPIGVIEENP